MRKLISTCKISDLKSRYKEICFFYFICWVEYFGAIQTTPLEFSCRLEAQAALTHPQALLNHDPWVSEVTEQSK